MAKKQSELSAEKLTQLRRSHRRLLEELARRVEDIPTEERCVHVRFEGMGRLDELPDACVYDGPFHDLTARVVVFKPATGPQSKPRFRFRKDSGEELKDGDDFKRYAAASEAKGKTN